MTPLHTVVLHAHGRTRIATVRRLTTRAEMWRHHVARLRAARECVAQSRNIRNVSVLRRAVRERSAR